MPENNQLTPEQLNDKINLLKFHITVKNDDNSSPEHVEKAKKGIENLIGELSADQLFSGNYAGTPMSSALIFGDNETANMLVAKEGVGSKQLMGNEAKPYQYPPDDALFHAIDVENRQITAAILQKAEFGDKEKHPKLVRQLYKDAIQNSFQKTWREVISSVQADHGLMNQATQSGTPEHEINLNQSQDRSF